MYEKKIEAPHIVCCTLFRNPAHYLGMHTIKEGTLNAVNNVAPLSRTDAFIFPCVSCICTLSAGRRNTCMPTCILLCASHSIAHATTALFASRECWFSRRLLKVPCPSFNLGRVHFTDCPASVHVIISTVPRRDGAGLLMSRHEDHAETT